MVNWSRFVPADFEYDFENDKLAIHHVIVSQKSFVPHLPLGRWDKTFLEIYTIDEAMECFFSDFEIHRNKRYQDRYQLIGRTLGGRTLKIIFQLKPKDTVRIITGWSLSG